MAVSSRALKTAVVTNAPRANAEMMLNGLGLGTRFAVLVLGDELARQLAAEGCKVGAVARRAEPLTPEGLLREMETAGVARAVLVPPGWEGSRNDLALAAARFYPRQPKTIAAVTGTSGKTSVAAFTRQIWMTLGHEAASIGTIGVVTPKREVYGSLTTPDPVALHRQLDQLAGEGITHLAMEASSHGLDQHRLDGVRVAAGGFTNLSRDHMDYHPDVAHYLDAKLRLFRNLVVDGGAAVISADHDCSAQVIEAARTRGLRLMTIGCGGDAGEGIRLIDAAIPVAVALKPRGTHSISRKRF